MTTYELIAKLTTQVAQTPALGECNVALSVLPEDTNIDLGFPEPGSSQNYVEIEGYK